jgi:hypothetical protein
MTTHGHGKGIHYITLHYTTLHHTTLHYTTLTIRRSNGSGRVGFFVKQVRLWRDKGGRREEEEEEMLSGQV